MKLKKPVLIVIFIVLILVFVGLWIVFFFGDDEENSVKPRKNDEQKVDVTLKKVKNLNEENEHVAFWIKIDSSKIDYPVLYSGDDYYLNYNYKKEYSVQGSIFIDKHNSLDDINLIIHGHNMKNGNMFHDLINYKEKGYYEKHKLIDFYTLNEHKKYEIVSVFLSKVYKKTDNVFKYYKFYGEKTEDEYNDYIDNVKKLSLFDTGVSAKYPSKLITLSTCEYTNDNGRLVVVAVEV